MLEAQVRSICIRIFEEDWEYYANRPTLMDAIEHHVSEGLYDVAAHHHLSYSVPVAPIELAPGA